MNNFYSGDQASLRYDEIIPLYKEAFAGPPWYEVSTCADALQRCVGGLSALAVGEMCEVCCLSPSRPAYQTNELAQKFDNLQATRPVSWYLEDVKAQLSLAALAWPASAERIAAEKYGDNDDMQQWLTATFGDRQLVWLDEVFAGKTLRPTTNLQNFRAMCLGFGAEFEEGLLAYRTITPQMLRAAERDFGSAATVCESVPDRRSFVLIDLDEARR